MSCRRGRVCVTRPPDDDPLTEGRRRPEATRALHVQGSIVGGYLCCESAGAAEHQDVVSQRAR
eukprot:5055705-Prymnesium_polylepis.1